MFIRSVVWALGTTVLFLSVSTAGEQDHRTLVSKFEVLKECGKVEEDPRDARTQSPWNVAIFRSSSKANSPDLSFKFINSGVLLSPRTVLAVFGGVYGPVTNNKKYYIPPPETFIVVAGLNSTSLKTADSFTQIKRVSYILPYKDHEEENTKFHFWLYHLTEPFNMTTPYVRAPCLPFFLRGLPSSWQLLHGGFTTPLTPDGLSLIAVEPATAVPEDQCQNLFKKFYGGQSADYVWCSRLLPGNHSRGNENSCLSHGSVVVSKVLQRWFLAGLTAFIPEKHKDGGCNQDTDYIHAKTLAHFEWMFQNIQCGPNKFPCANTTCIPLNEVCNRVANCQGEDLSDEDPLFCEAQNRCRKGPATIQCGVKEKCIRPDQLCNGVPDCDDGSDEDREFCSPSANRRAPSPTKRSTTRITHTTPVHVTTTTVAPRIPTKYRNSNSRKKCFPLPVSEGTRVECKNHVTNETMDCSHAVVNTMAILSCEKYYSAKFRVPSIQMTCTSSGTWHPFRPFACEPNCGILSTGITALITHGQETSRKNSFPWHAAIFREGPVTGQFHFICGGSLIERKIILTAAHCIADVSRSPQLRSKYKIVLAPLSSIYEDNEKDKYAKIFNVKLVRVPTLYNPRTLQSDIAMIELVESVTYGQHIRPVCYLQKSSVINPSVGKLGKVPGFGVDENGEISFYLKFASLPIVSTANCSRMLQREIQPSTFCAGYDNGTSLCNGDSGGGIIFPERGGDYERYSIKGIVSAEASTRSRSKTCHSGSYSIYTNVDAFRDFILETLEAIEL